MSNLDDLKSSFAAKLDEKIAARRQRTDADLESLRAALRRQAAAALPADITRRLQGAAERLQGPRGQSSPARAHSPAQPLIDLGGGEALRDLDAAFIEIFNLAAFYPTQPLDYPTVYCESLEEFFTPLVETLNLSPQARESELARMIARAEEDARRSNGGGIFGYNLPGAGCYLNGWLFVYGRGMPPRAALDHPELRPRVLATAAHEKLGHGFLSVYSALGRVKTQLGITLLETAQRFGLRPADNPVEGLRRAQAEVLGMASQLVEEGWATWVETYLQTGGATRHDLAEIVRAVEKLPGSPPEREETRGALLFALAALFGEEDVPLPALLQAVKVVEILGGGLDDYFGPALGQPLRYAVGELLLAQAAANLGPVCAPYAALIAANIHFDPQAISLGDLREMLATQPGLNPDARLAALSRLTLERKDDVRQLARRAAAAFSFSPPDELKD